MESIIKPVIWTTRSKKDLGKLMQFYSKLYSEDKAIEIANNIHDGVKILENKGVDLTNIGAIDEIFSYLNQEYRKLINNHCKITYRIGKQNIYIVRIFDTRQNPNKNRYINNSSLKKI